MTSASTGRKRLKIIFISLLGGAAVLAVLLLFSDLYRVLLKPLDIGGPIDPDFGDVILVLGGGLRPRVEIGFSTAERLNLAVEIYRQRKRKMIISDGSLYKNSPAIDKIKNYLLNRGVDEDHIILEGHSQTTFESGLNSLKIIETEKFNQVVVCTSPYHQKRSEMILHHIGFPDFRMARMTRSEIYRSGNLRQHLRNLKLIFRDYIAIMKFKIYRH